MAKTFEVTAPDGHVLEVTGPDDATQEQALAQAQKLYQPKSAAAPAADTRTSQEQGKPWVSPTNPLYAPLEGMRESLHMEANQAQGAPQALTGIPSTISNGASALWDMISGKGTGKAQAMIEGALKPATTSIQGAGALVAPKSVNAPSEQEFNQAAQGAGANAAGLALGEGIAKAGGAADALRGGLKKVTTPEAQMASAIELRNRITNRPEMRIPFSASDLLKDAGNLLTRTTLPAARASISESIAKFMTANDKAPTYTGKAPIYPDLLQDPAVADEVSSAGNYRTGLDIRPNIAPSGEASRSMADFPNNAESIPRPDPKAKLAQAIQEHQWNTPPSAPPPVLDAPSVNKWIGAKASQMMRGADPGARILSEGLVGVDKTATAANVKSALGSAGADIEAELKQADARGVQVNAKSIFDSAIADANKPFAEGTDETFQKKLDQITTDANAQVEDLSKVKPSDVHTLRKMIGKAIDWTTRDSSPFNNTLKKIYSGLNDQLGDINSDIRQKQLRWGDLFQADRSLAESLTKDRAGRGSGASIPQPKPTAAEILRRKPSGRMTSKSF